LLARKNGATIAVLAKGCLRNGLFLLLVLVLVLELPSVETGRRDSSTEGWPEGIHPAGHTAHSRLEHERNESETGHALIPSSRSWNSSGSNRSTERVNIALDTISADLEHEHE
jgi:hypothetical protein